MLISREIFLVVIGSGLLWVIAVSFLVYVLCRANKDIDAVKLLFLRKLFNMFIVFAIAGIIPLLALLVKVILA